MRLLPLALLLIALPGCALLRSEPRPEPPMVLVPGGTFTMGNPDGADGEPGVPAHPAEIAPFHIMTREVTFAEFDRFADARKIARPDSGAYPRGARAVVHVTWAEAEAFCRWIGGRLPTEVEWEWAARGGEAAQRFAGTDDPAALGRFARYAENTGYYATREVTLQPNPLGLYDLSGNAWEWIGAYYDVYPKPGEAPVWEDLAARDKRILRGGSFRSGEVEMQTFWRGSTFPDNRSDQIGFRCVRPADA